MYLKPFALLAQVLLSASFFGAERNLSKLPKTCARDSNAEIKGEHRYSRGLESGGSQIQTLQRGQGTESSWERLQDQTCTAQASKVIQEQLIEVPFPDKNTKTGSIWNTYLFCTQNLPGQKPLLGPA